MKLLKLLLITTLAFAIGACGGVATEQKKADDKKAENTSEKNDETAKTDETAVEKKDEADSSADSPTQAVTDFAKAYEAKNVAALKKRFSSKSLEDMEKGAKQMKKSLDDQLENFINQAQLPFKGVPEMRNEKITGDTATLEVKADGEWDTMPFVKEDGMWKIAFEKGKQ